MIEKLAFVWPEITLFLATCIVMVTGLSQNPHMRRLSTWICGIALVIAGGLAINSPVDPNALFPGLMPFTKTLVAAVGLLILLLISGTVDRELESAVASGKAKFEAIRATRAEFYAFFLFSLTGVMLCASADDLIWLFLALELVSLPTYIMVTISTRGMRSQEAGVKYFFLGALGAAIFLYGFAMLYGATGTTNLGEIAAIFRDDGINAIGMLGLLLSIVGVSFKIAAFPMHFYTPDVYQGAASPVSAMLAFVPKTAGFIAIIMLAGLAGWGFGENANQLPAPVHALLWIMAAVTMTVGNVMALLQNSIKRMMAYSSIAHSGYMLVGVLAGPGDSFASSGIAAVLFYLLCYGVMNIGIFAVLACLERDTGEEPDSIDDIRGMCKSHPLLGWTLVLCSLSLLGFPPLLGFIGKLGLFAGAISAGLIPLAVILGLNSAIAAFYYLRIVAAAYLEPRDKPIRLIPTPFFSRKVSAVLSAMGVVVLIAFAQRLIEASTDAARFNGQTSSAEIDPASGDAHQIARGDSLDS